MLYLLTLAIMSPKIAKASTIHDAVAGIIAALRLTFANVIDSYWQNLCGKNVCGSYRNFVNVN